MIVGIFTTWETDLFDKPENVFKHNLERNPNYPFEELEPNIYVLTVTSTRFGIGVVLCLLTAIVAGAIYGNQGSVDELIVYPVFIFLGFLSMVLYHWQKRTFVLDSNNKMYEFYRGHKLIYRGHYHNIYIRLKGQNTGNGDIYYNVTLNGYLIDEESITSSSPHHDKLAKLGRKLAHRLDLNFFDHTDKSRYHVIRHRCPYVISTSDSSSNFA